MSFKAKDLSYDDTQPAFLRRLRGEMAGDGSGRHENPIQRNKRLKQDDEEDAPTYVLEDTNQSMSKAEYEAMVAGKDSGNDGTTEEDGDKTKVNATAPQAKDTIVEVGKVTKKRKVVKVVGEEKNENENKEEPRTSEKKVIKKAKKKGKPVKLSFGDQEE